MRQWIETILWLKRPSFKLPPGGLISSESYRLILLLSSVSFSAMAQSALSSVPAPAPTTPLQRAIEEFRTQTAVLNASVSEVTSATSGTRSSATRGQAKAPAIHGNLYENI